MINFFIAINIFFKGNFNFSADLFERQKKEIEKALKDRNYSKLKEFAHSEGGILTGIVGNKLIN